MERLGSSSGSASLSDADRPAYNTLSAQREIDLHLAVIAAITPYDYAWTLRDLAEVCGVTHECIRLLERKALQRLRHPTRLKQLQDL